MIKNYIRIAVRNLWKSKIFTIINVVGLGLAMAFCLMQLIQVQSNFEKDSFHPFPDRTYRILTNVTENDGKINHLATTPFPLAKKLQDEHSGIEQSVRVNRSFGGTFSNGLKSLRLNGLYADPSYFYVFGFKLEKGKPAVAPRTIVLTHEMADRYFGDADPIGKVLSGTELGNLTITGVFAPLGNLQTHLKSDAVVSMSTFSLLNDVQEKKDWLSYNTYTFVLLEKNIRPERLETALAGIVADNNKTVDFKEIKNHHFRFQKLSDISPDFENLIDNPYVEPISKMAVGMLVPLVIILLAGFNYVNLTLTKSLSRAKEVGVRKVAGAKRSQLVVQFLTESLVVAVMALGVGYLGLVFMKSYIHVGWLVWEVRNPVVLWLFFVGFTLITGIVAGILPAQILSSYQPVKILKGEVMPVGVGRIGFRKFLTVIQFVVALAFMTFVEIMNSQFEYMATDNENFNRKNILNIPVAGEKNDQQLAEDFSKAAGVEGVGLANASFNEASGQTKISRLGGEMHAGKKDALTYSVDAGFIKNMNLKFIAGKNLPVATDTTLRFVIINTKAAKSLGWANPADAVGQAIMLSASEVIVSGVVQDFCVMRYEMPVSPLVLGFDPSVTKMVSLKIAEQADREKIIVSLKKIWTQHYPHESFVYSWYDDQLYDEYISGGDKRVTQIMIFAVFVIAGLGLFGMVTFTTEKRTKEVGVRKVIGASVAQIMNLLSWSFLKLIIIAAVIALPIGYVLGVLFLNIFTFHPVVSAAVFLTGFGCLLVVGLLTIGIQTYKTAVTNPAKTLRND